MATPKQWREIRLEYQKGEGSLEQLSKKHSVPFSTMKKRSMREKWTLNRARIGTLVELKQEEKIVDAATQWVDDTLKRSKKFRKIIDDSINQLTQADGTTLVEPADLNFITLSESRVDDMARRSLGLPDKPAVQINNYTQNNIIDIQKVRDIWNRELGWSNESIEETA